ncbi:hypothetical protein ACUNWD_09260 [Sunxiuqinia sp. A32]|uniref:hypothetical protein n=1 Tax=Sunxiuqinia sp. A32 TaxID=3461496 RepID=UPI00404598C9
MMNEVPVPIRFNAFKHHRNYMLEVLAKSSTAEFIELLDPLCHNYIDIYIGEFTSFQIAKSIIDILSTENLFSSNEFKIWLDRNGGHRSIKLVDQSEWILRLGEDSDRFIHIHPARTGKHVVRFKGSTLKTVVKMMTKKMSDNEVLKLEDVNEAREQINLSPIKKLEAGKGILRCYHFLKKL